MPDIEQKNINRGYDLVSRMGEFQGAESVEESHPDALMDGGASRILDTIIRLSAPSGIRPRVAVEGAIKGNDPERIPDTFPDGVVLLVGEVTLPPDVTVDYGQIMREAIRARGYNDPTIGFSADTVQILTKITQQSSDINRGVTKNNNILAAGDQGVTVGAAIRGDGPEYMPLAVSLAHALTGRLTEVKKKKIIDGLKPDGKSQVTLQYRNGKFENVRSITIATAHDRTLKLPAVQQEILRGVIMPVFDRYNIPITPETQIIVNGAGEWNKYGPSVDAGEVGRKLAVAFLSALYPLGGGTPFGKDPTKIDKSGALVGRFGSRFIVENGLADRAQITMYWTIGQEIPDAINIDTFGTEHYSLQEIYKHVERNIALTVSGAIEQLNLYGVLYEPLAAGGIFGRPEYPWEQVPRI
jgi:S-adenosylmethionine synthetase